MAKISVQQALRKASKALKDGEPDKAREFYGEVLDRFPNNVAAREGLAALNGASSIPSATAQGTATPGPAGGPALTEKLLELAKLLGQHKSDEVARQCEILLETCPRSDHVWVLLGSAEMSRGRLNSAGKAFNEACQINPANVMAWEYLGSVCSKLSRYEDAISAYGKALELKPGNLKAQILILNAKLQILDWSAFDDVREISDRIGMDDPGAQPTSLFILSDSPETHAGSAKRYASRTYAGIDPAPFSDRSRSAGEPIRVGFFSADFREHPVMHLISGLFREHDRERFAFSAYSSGSFQPSALRDALERNVVKLVDITAMSNEEVAGLTREHGLDIAIDLNGYTLGGRTHAFAHRLAPVQINYLGFPGTMGASFMDYIIADRMLIPEELRGCYSEQVVYLPDTYMPCDNTRVIADTGTTRADHGLPQDGLVLCSFNQAYKIGPREFDIWMRVLARVEGSVLWLKRPGAASARAALPREAQARGIDPSRIVYADTLPHPEHLERHRLADLFVDTFNFNAHTTANEALWAGLPVVTKVGRQFSARVAASLLSAVGMSELIAETEEAYEALILDLATNPERLSAVRAKLAANRLTTPLFDTAGYTRNFEKALAQIHERHIEA